MNSGDDYLNRLLNEQKPPEGLRRMLQNTRTQFEEMLRENLEDISDEDIFFYYAGSYKKETMIRESFDLDLVLYFPSTSPLSVSDIHAEVRRILQSAGYAPRIKGVSLQCNMTHPTYGDFHVDVVPGKAIDSSNNYANLYKFQQNRSIRTSVKVHVDAVKATRKRNVIKLLKLWKVRKRVDCSTFILELLFIRYLNSADETLSLDALTNGLFRYITNHILEIRLVDPANSNNVVSDDLNNAQKRQLRDHAQSTYDADSWPDVYG